MIDTIFLDMDGVIANYVGRLEHLFNEPELIDKIVNQDPVQNSQHSSPVHTVLGFSGPDDDANCAAFYEEVYRRDPNFFENIEPYAWLDDLWSRLKGMSERTILMTKPSLTEECHGGKFNWIQEQFGFGFVDYAMTAHKWAMAHEGCLLIDDDPNNCKQFRDHGGAAIVFPQPWNGDERDHEDPEKWRDVINQLEQHDFNLDPL